MSSDDQRRLFFGAQVHACWPHALPDGRLLEESERHMTLAFLGQTSLSSLQKILPSIPHPSFRLGLSGKCTRFIFLPKQHPRVVASHVQWLNGEEKLTTFQKNLSNWLITHHYQIDPREFTSHVTVARAPFSLDQWSKITEEFPLILSGIHLYESVGHLTYRSLWNYPLLAPFEEFEHTADIAFRIQGETLHELLLHAQIALAFKFPPLVSYLPMENCSSSSIDNIVMALNALIAKADEEVGAPFKAVSFHGTVKKLDSAILQWEMIVDV